MNRDVFISHASEDKASIAIPFAKELEKYGITYWLDLKELVPGDQLSVKVFKEGIAKSNYVVVFISKSFLVKGWTNAELRNALTRQMRTNTKIVIPFLVDVRFSDLLEYYPEFENIFCGDLKNGVGEAAYQLSKIVNNRVISDTVFFRRHELLSILNWYKDSFIEKLQKMTYDNIFASYSPELSEALYAYIFTNYSEQKQRQFVLDRLNMNQTFPAESFFQISLAENSNWVDKNRIINKILKQYPMPQQKDFLSVVLPRKEVSFFQKIGAGVFTFGAEENDSYRKEWIAKTVNVYLDEYYISTTPITRIKFMNFFTRNTVLKDYLLAKIYHSIR